MKFLLVFAFLALVLCILACLWLLKRFSEQNRDCLQLIKGLVEELKERLPPAPVGLAEPDATETEVQALVGDFYNEVLEAVFVMPDDIDADGSYPPPTPEELAQLEAAIANERFQPPQA